MLNHISPLQQYVSMLYVSDSAWQEYQRHMVAEICAIYRISPQIVGEIREGKSMNFSEMQLTVAEIEHIAASLYGLSAKEAKEKEQELLLTIRKQREQEALHHMFSRGTFKPDLQK